MKLLTKDIEKKLTDRNALIAQRHRAGDWEYSDDKVIVKYFNPVGRGTWYVMNGEKQSDGDWICFGLVDLFEREWGYFSLNELESVELPFGLKIEGDMHYSGTYQDLKEG